MKPVRTARLLAATPHGVELDCGGGITCRISLLQPDLGRVVYLRQGALRVGRTWAVPADGVADVPWEGRDRLDESSWPGGAVELDDRGHEIVLTTPAMVVTVALAPFAITWALPDGRVFARERAQATSFGAARIQHHFVRDVRDRYHGLGDKTGRLNLHGRRLRISALDSLGFDPESGDPLYKSWPFLIAVDGETGIASGLFYDSMAEAAFDLGCAHDNYHGLYRSYEAEGGDLDYYVFPGPRVVDVTRRFLALTGRPALPPRWTLGFAQTAMALADSANGQERVGEWIANIQALDIPASGFHFGSGYTMIGPKRYVFTWNRSKYPDPDALMRQFHAAGIHVVANLKPCLLDDHPRYAEPAEGYVKDADGHPVIRPFWDGEGAHLDFTNPAAIAWWQQGVTQDVLGHGIDAAWNDNNEYGFSEEQAQAAGFGAPMPFDLARPLQALLMTRASYEATIRHRPTERPFTVTRAGTPGAQRYAQSWSGDNETSWRGMAWNLRLGLTMSLSGLGNTGHDVGGFSGPVPDAELLIRWTQAGSVHPRFIMNSWKPDGVYTSPWLHPEAVPMIRDAIRLRYRLMPYLYSLMHDFAAAGTPPLLPTFAVFDDDPATQADCPDLMLGPFLLAAPVVEPGARSRRVYLPAGPECWFDFWSGEALPAGRTVALAAPLDRLPLALAAGAILPMTDSADFSRTHDEPSRQVRICPGPGTGSSRFVLVEDDGITQGGPATRVVLDMSWTPESITLAAATDGDHALPYEAISVVLHPSDGRALHLAGKLELRAP
jgi:alpha-glucosidase